MTSPRHLWSGDWELDSTAAREELEKRRAQSDRPAATPPEAPSPRARPSTPARPSTTARVLDALRAARAGLAGARSRWGYELRVSLLIALAILLTAAAAFGITAIVVNAGDGQSSAATVNRAHTLLGIDVTGSPAGVMVTNVVPGSAGQAAGLRPGDLIIQINIRHVGTVDGVSAALAGLHPGDTVAVQFSRGPISFTTQTTLGPGPYGGP
ncbi:MAG TPA: PDZ domain-containing protein [Solirubrobacteraceae bacterium]|jgi:hypothetical protein|nr:PDZ domain-containing protein [Solirubrobacteraceae bacterium]